jgi:DNA gyrase/topoisomerase IV subunit B
MTFFLQFFPDLVKNDHLYILQTPLFPRAEQEGDHLLLQR